MVVRAGGDLYLPSFGQALIGGHHAATKFAVHAHDGLDVLWRKVAPFGRQCRQSLVLFDIALVRPRQVEERDKVGIVSL